MENNKDSKINITYLNKELLRTNNLLFKIDRNRFMHAANVLDNEALAFYLVASQKDKRYMPLLNLDSDSQLIIPQLESSFITVGELASFFMVDIDELYSGLEKVDFELDRFRVIIDQLWKDKNKFNKISDSVGEFTFVDGDKTFSLSLADIAQFRNIPFEVLYTEYVLSERNIAKALQTIEKKQQLKKDLKALRKVLSIPVTETQLKKYRRMVQSGRKYSLNLYTSIMIGAPSIGIKDETSIMKMFLTDFDSQYIDKEIMSEEDQIKFFKYIALGLNGGALDADEVRELIQFSKSKRLPVSLNTMTFMYLYLTKTKNKIDYILDMIESVLAENELLTKDEHNHEELVALIDQFSKYKDEQLNIYELPKKLVLLNEKNEIRTKDNI